MTNYAILTTPRTGSTLLCEYLVNTGELGIRSIDDANLFIGTGQGMKDGYPKSWVDYIKRNRTPNGVLGCKFMFEYFDTEIRSNLSYKQGNNIMGMFNHFVWLRRKDVVRQAVSWHVAQRTTRWHSTNLDRKEQPVEYDFYELAWKVAFIEGMNHRYEVWFELHNISPLYIWYDEVVEKPEQVIGWVYKHLGIERRSKKIKASLKKLHDPRKEDYVTRFKSELAGRVAVPDADGTGVATD